MDPPLTLWILDHDPGMGIEIGNLSCRLLGSHEGKAGDVCVSVCVCMQNVQCTV